MKKINNQPDDVRKRLIIQNLESGICSLYEEDRQFLINFLKKAKLEHPDRWHGEYFKPEKTTSHA